MSSYRETLDYLYGLLSLGIRPGLSATERLLSSLKDPQKEYPSIHVAGTNGKGSTSATLEAILTEAGFSAGLYTSPHLERFNERIRISGEAIADSDVVRVAEAVKRGSEAAFAEGKGPTFFEFTTAMAFQYFKEKKVDIAVLETGMGGRLDATNIVTPLVSIITNVGFDHTLHLGEDLAAIAGEKAGIIKERVPVVTGVEAPLALPVIEEEAKKRGSRLFRYGADFRGNARPVERGFDYSGMSLRLTGLSLKLRGSHQFKNASCALAAVEVLQGLGYAIGEEAIREGLAGVFWPGRFEVMRERPLVILDCAHNPDGASVLAAALREFLASRRLVLVTGVMIDKDIDGIFSHLVPLASVVILTKPAMDRAAAVELLEKKLVDYKKPVILTRTVKEACSRALKEASDGDAICVTGSIFTVGEARGFFTGCGV